MSTMNPQNLGSLGQRMRFMRVQKSWTQEQLAARAGTNQAVIQKIENGKSLRPRQIMQIAEVLEVNPAWLQFGEPWAERGSCRESSPPSRPKPSSSKAGPSAVEMGSR